MKGYECSKPLPFGCMCQVKWSGVTKHSTLCFPIPLACWRLNSPAFLPASLLLPCLLPCLPGPAGRCSLARKAQPAGSPGLQLGRFLIPREEADFTAQPWQTSLQFSEFVMAEVFGTAGSTCPALRGSETEQLLMVDGPSSFPWPL